MFLRVVLSGRWLIGTHGARCDRSQQPNLRRVLQAWRDWQRSALRRFGSFTLADECLDDFQRRTRFALGAPALEIRGQLPVGAQDFLVADIVVSRVTVRGGAFADSSHRCDAERKKEAIVARRSNNVAAAG